MLYLAVAARTFRRYSTYRAATLSGIFTNSVFGVIYSYAYLALWQQNPTAGGYDAADAVTFVWIGQSLLMTVALWGGGTTDDLSERIRSGEIAIDLYRPVGLIRWYLAGDLGRALFHYLSRGLGPMVVGALVFDLIWPTPGRALLFLLSVILAVVISFGIRFLFAALSFWLLDASGPRVILAFTATFFSGMTLPLVLFPGWLGQIAYALPFAGVVQLPADIWLGKREGLDLVWTLGFQVLWIVILLGTCHAMLAAATRKVVIQGG